MKNSYFTQFSNVHHYNIMNDVPTLYFKKLKYVSIRH